MGMHDLGLRLRPLRGGGKALEPNGHECLVLVVHVHSRIFEIIGIDAADVLVLSSERYDF